MASNDRTGASMQCGLVGKASVEHDVVTSRTGLVACANGTGGTVLASEGDSEGMVLSRSQSSLQWVSAVRGLLLMLLAAVVVVDACWVVLGIWGVSTRIVHEFAIAIGTKVAGLAWVVVAVAIAAVVDDGDVVAIVVIVAPCTVLGIETVPARVVHEVAVVTGAEVAGLVWVAAVMADVDGVAGAVVAHWLVFDVVVGVVVVVAGDLRLF